MFLHAPMQPIPKNMRFLSVGALVCLASSVAGWDFTNLLGRIRHTTLDYDHQAATLVNQEENDINSIQLREDKVDRELADIIEKFDLKKDSGPFSLLQKRRHHKSHKIVAHGETPIEADMKILDQTEKNRERAEAEFLDTERKIADLPEKLSHRKERRQREQLEVPLEDEDDADRRDAESDDGIDDRP